MASKPKPSPITEAQVVPLADLAEVKAALAKGLPSGCSISVRKGGRGCPDGHAVVSAVPVGGAA